MVKGAICIVVVPLKLSELTLSEFAAALMTSGHSLFPDVRVTGAPCILYSVEYSYLNLFTDLAVHAQFECTT